MLFLYPLSLIVKSEAFFDENKASFKFGSSIDILKNIFIDGAKFMCENMCAIDGKSRHFNPQKPYNYYGFMKYSLCFFVFFVAIFCLFQIHFLFTFLAVLVFYGFEVWFLFLFPLLIDDAEKPLVQSIKMTQKIGVFRAIFTVLPIGFFMVFGFFNFQSPFRNWQIGCLAILFWYNMEKTRNAVQTPF